MERGDEMNLQAILLVVWRLSGSPDFRLMVTAPDAPAQLMVSDVPTAAA